MTSADAAEKIEPSLDEDTEDNEGNEGEESSGSGFDAKKIILFIVLPLFILAGIGGGLYFSGTLQKMLGNKASEEGHETTDSHGKSKKKNAHGEEINAAHAYFLEIPDMLVNLNTDNGNTRYLKLSIQLELESQSDLVAVEAVMPRVVDQFQTYLRELRVQDLRGSQGIYRLQMELLSRVNAAAYPVEVKDVLFQNILIQ